MILATFRRPDGSAAIGAVQRDAGRIIDLQRAHWEKYGVAREAFDDMIALMTAGERGLDAAREIERAAARSGDAAYALPAIELLAPVPIPAQMRDFSVFERHMRQAGAAIGRLRAKRLGKDPAEVPLPDALPLPDVFFRQPLYYKANRFNVVGPNADIVWPDYCEKLDYELELGVFIGRRCKNVEAESARACIFGYTIFNDFSARDAQELEMSAPFGPAKGKDFDTGNAMGPWIVTRDELTDPYSLEMRARVDGETWSRGSSRGMVHGFERMIEHVSREETLHPGEFLGSGTVGGGSGLELGRWLQPGAIVELEVEGIGILRNRVVRGHR